MARHRSNYLIDQLLSNHLSGAELDELLAGLHRPDDRQTYSDALKMYFNELLNEPDPPPESDGNGESLLNKSRAKS